MSNKVAAGLDAGRAARTPHSASLHGRGGARKYLNRAERRRFLDATGQQRRDYALFCLVLAWTGGRISEVLALAPAAFDLARGVVAIETLKRRRSGIVREVPIPPWLMKQLDKAYRLRECQTTGEGACVRLWPWCRQTGWRIVKAVMRAAEVPSACAMPKALRHGFAVASLQVLIPPHLVQRWLGHASIRTTAIYMDVVGPEELAFAARLWKS